MFSIKYWLGILGDSISLVRNAANKGRVVLGMHFLAQVIREVLTIVLPCSVLDSAK